ncbi:putative NADH dehydrogenase/NAD(P)H nitroreductase [Trichinella spiralis]|uniref:NADH dehydrogenase/NAD(P)H nitroreductase n=1 Tax=Trichinella spiralis TaxID=6334 RepID=A0ABR3L0V8_TRISP
MRFFTLISLLCSVIFVFNEIGSVSAMEETVHLENKNSKMNCLQFLSSLKKIQIFNSRVYPLKNQNLKVMRWNQKK